MSEDLPFSKCGREYGMLSPSELVLSDISIKYRELVENIGSSKNIKNIFNNWIEGDILEKQISFRKIPLMDGIVSFSNAVLHKPYYEKRDQKCMLTPKMARDNNQTYSGQLDVTITFTSFNKSLAPKSEVISVGNLPIMLGSKYCHLYGKTKEEIIAMGECPNDPLGYFIINGTEKVINTQEKLRVSQVFTFKVGNTYETSMTCAVPIGTAKVNLFKTKKPIGDVYEVGIQNFRCRLPIFALFDILLYESLGACSLQDTFALATNMILKYVQAPYKLQVKYCLNLSRISASDGFFEMKVEGSYANICQNYTNDSVRFYNYILNLIYSSSDDIGESTKTTRLLDEPDMKFKTVKRLIDDKILINLFPQIYSASPNEKPEKIQKAEMLAYMIAHNCQCYLGKPSDDRDNWVNKRLETPGRSMELLYNCLWKIYVDEGINKNINTSIGDTVFNPSKIFNPIITDQYVNAFGPNAWGAKGKSSKYKENITDTMKRETIMAIFSQNGKISTPRNSRSKAAGLRALQNTQLGYICMSETPEGERCGLVKNIAITTYISIERPIQDFEAILNQLKLEQKVLDDISPLSPHPILANGKFYGWCAQSFFVPYIKQLKRDNKLPFDCCVYYNSSNNIVEYNCDGSRLLRPLLLINKVTENLVVDEKQLWDESIDEMYRRGGLELVDSREQDDIVLAMSIDLYRELLIEKKNIYIEKAKYSEIRMVDINDTDYEKFKVLHALGLSRDQFHDDLEAITDKKIKIKFIYDTFDYLGKKFFKKYLEVSVQTVLDMFREYALVAKNKELLNNMVEEFKVDDKIENFELEVYTHCEFDPISLYGIASCLIPKSNCNAGPRTVYQASMCKQALGAYHYNKHLRFDTSFKVLENTQRPMFESFLAETFGQNIMPSGQNPIVAYLALDANNEDAIVCKQDYFDSEFCVYTKFSTIKYISKNSSNEIFKLPFFTTEKQIKLSHALQTNGLPKIGSRISVGDYVLGKVVKDKVTREEIPKCVIAQIGEEGFVDRILVTKNAEGSTIFKIKLRQRRYQKCGDKLASRYSQKGTVGKTLPANRLPRISSGPNKGLVPDFFINPNSSISRMTQGKFKEFFETKAALYANFRVDATVFHAVPESEICRILMENGMDKYGDEEMEHPNGKKLDTKVFVAPCNYQCLRHHVDDKIQARGTGKDDPISRQPSSGRSMGGGLRLGEMERDAFISHGSSSILMDRMLVCSDIYTTSYCMTCGFVCPTNTLTSDSNCSTCGAKKSIGILTQTYIFKLITNMLNAIGFGLKLKLTHLYNTKDRKESKFLA